MEPREPSAPGSLLGELAGEIPGELLDRLDRDPNAVVPPPAQVRALVSDLGLFGNQAVSTPELAQARAELLAFARRAIDALREGRDPDVPPTPEEETGAAVLSAFVVRPVLLVQDDEFVEARPPWESLERFRSRIQRSLPAVGRFALDGDLRAPLIGTGWVAAPGMVMTNRHVVKRFAAPVSPAEGETRWRMLDGMTAWVDFEEEEVGAQGYRGDRVFDVPAGAEILVHPEADLALVPIAGASRGPEPRLAPVPLVLAAGGEPMVEGREVYAVGYPADDPLNPDPLSKNVLFQAIYRVKRLQPGKVMQVMEEGGLKVLHDCSTLGGNSGSCLVDLATNQVVGLHYAGYHRRTNLAVALWDLVGDPLLHAAGVRFYGE
jgi:hypothetical protein